MHKNLLKACISFETSSRENKKLFSLGFKCEGRTFIMHCLKFCINV